MMEQVDYNLCYIFGQQFPEFICTGFSRHAATRRLHASRHYVPYASVVLSRLLHQRLGKANEAKLGGAVSRTLRKSVLARKTPYVEDEAASTRPHARDGFVAAIEEAVKICLYHGAPA